MRAALIPYFIAEGAERSRFRAGDSQLADWALEEWERSGGGVLRFERVEREDAALLRFAWLPWAEDAALGRMDPAVVNGRRRRIDYRAAGRGPVPAEHPAQRP